MKKVCLPPNKPFQGNHVWGICGGYDRLAQNKF